MAPYFGLRGAALSRAIMWLVVCPAFVTYGYNQGVTGGLLTLKSFAEEFPQMNTLTTTGSEKHYNSTIQGAYRGIFGHELNALTNRDLLTRDLKARSSPCIRWEA